MFPSIDSSEVGATGLLWLFASYGYALFFASNLISEGSDLLMLVPSMAGIVGGVVLPLLGAVPDGAIMLFSGLGPLESAQEKLSVGVGALAGSTIMLLTVPWAMCIFAGSVDIVDGQPNYFGKPKLTPGRGMHEAGVAVKPVIRYGGYIMIATTVPYFLIQVPAYFLHGPSEEIAEGEKIWSLAGFVICVLGFIGYLVFQITYVDDEKDILYVEVLKKKLTDGSISLKGALHDLVREQNENLDAHKNSVQGYDTISDNSILVSPPSKIEKVLKEVMRIPFKRFDCDNNGSLDIKEVRGLFGKLQEKISLTKVAELFDRYDVDRDGTLSLDEVVTAAYDTILQDSHNSEKFYYEVNTANGENDEEEEEEEIPEEFSALPPAEQQYYIKKRAFMLLTCGTVLVLVFADPMVEVMQDIGVRMNIPPFYISFVLAPLASNASEFISSQYYALKKTSKSITVSLSALEGAAAMNNTFCLSIFMGLIYIRGLAWQYTAETLAIVLVQLILGTFAMKTALTTFDGYLVLFIFPLSIAFVWFLENLGFD